MNQLMRGQKPGERRDGGGSGGTWGGGKARKRPEENRKKGKRGFPNDYAIGVGCGGGEKGKRGARQGMATIPLEWAGHRA